MIYATARILMWALLIKNGLGSISIEVEPLVVKIDKSDIDIRCIVDGTNLSKVYSIKLIRSNTTVVTVSRKGVVWKDAALDNTSGVTVNASVSNAMSSYLHLEIPKTVVRYPEDMGSYQCSLFAVDSLGGLVGDHSLIVNITGFSASTFQSTSERYFSQTNQKNTKEIMPCTCSNGNRLTLYMQSSQKKDSLGFHPRSENSFFALTQVERANSSMSYMPPLNTAKPTVQLPKRPKTAAANLQKQHIEKTALKVEKPFRYKIRQGGSETQLSRPPSRQQSEPSISLRMLDPRNPNSLRPPSTKSIPSKCARYILGSKQKQMTALPLPTPLEEQLLAERFPMMGERVYRQHSDLALRSKKMTYCVEHAVRESVGVDQN